MKGRENLLGLLEYFKAQDLLQEIVVGMSDHEAQEMYNHICRMHDLNQDDGKED